MSHQQLLSVDAESHYQQRYETTARERALLVGIIVGAVAVLLWESLVATIIWRVRR